MNIAAARKVCEAATEKLRGISVRFTDEGSVVSLAEDMREVVDDCAAALDALEEGQEHVKRLEITVTLLDKALEEAQGEVERLKSELRETCCHQHPDNGSDLAVVPKEKLGESG